MPKIKFLDAEVKRRPGMPGVFQAVRYCFRCWTGGFKWGGDPPLYEFAYLIPTAMGHLTRNGNRASKDVSYNIVMEAGKDTEVHVKHKDTLFAIVTK